MSIECGPVEARSSETFGRKTSKSRGGQTTKALDGTAERFLALPLLGSHIDGNQTQYRSPVTVKISKEKLV